MPKYDQHLLEHLYQQVIVNEALPLSKAKELTKMKNPDTDIVNNVFGDKNRLVFPIDVDPESVSLEAKSGQLYYSIDSLIYHHGYRLSDTVTDYIKGVAFKIKDDMSLDRKNPVKIGKLLQAFEPDGEIEITDPEDRTKKKTVVGKPLLHAFKNDPSRQSSGKYLVVISRHPYDIAGMSTDRNWTSCMNLGTSGINYDKRHQGANKHYVERDIQQGTLIAYLVRESEKMKNGKVSLKRPISRILMKPFESNDSSDVPYGLGAMYGVKVPEFHEFVKGWISNNLNADIDKSVGYHLNPDLYDYEEDEAVDFDLDQDYQTLEKFKEVIYNIYDSYDFGALSVTYTCNEMNAGEFNVNYSGYIRFYKPESLVIVGDLDGWAYNDRTNSSYLSIKHSNLYENENTENLIDAISRWDSYIDTILFTDGGGQIKIVYKDSDLVLQHNEEDFEDFCRAMKGRGGNRANIEARIIALLTEHGFLKVDEQVEKATNLLSAIETDPSFVFKVVSNSTYRLQYITPMQPLNIDPKFWHDRYRDIYNRTFDYIEGVIEADFSQNFNKGVVGEKLSFKTFFEGYKTMLADTADSFHIHLFFSASEAGYRLSLEFNDNKKTLQKYEIVKYFNSRLPFVKSIIEKEVENIDKI